MPAFPDHEHHVRRVVLPSGKTIEVVYFDEPAVPARAASSDAAAGELHVCAGCACDLVYPVEWEEAGPGHWAVELRCPNCEWRATGIYAQQALDSFDEHLDAGTELLIRDLGRLVQANMEDEIKRFVGALATDLIVPEDF